MLGVFTVMEQSDIDILENSLRQKGPLLDILLRDRTMSLATHSLRNIIWATDSYEKLGRAFAPKKQMKADLVTGQYGKLIQPRAVKSRDEQQRRTKDKAEVFTPLSIVDQMNKQIDWAGQNYPVITENWRDYVRQRRLEITCGEAPFIASRYDPTKRAQLIKIENRVGFLDRKLRVVSDYCQTSNDWLNWAREAYKASYGYEWQGDNLLIARENLLYTLIDYYKEKFGHTPSHEIQLEFAGIISWNIWQMDGIKCIVPCSDDGDNSREAVVSSQLSLVSYVEVQKFSQTTPSTARRVTNRRSNKLTNGGVYAKIKDWRSIAKAGATLQRGHVIRFIDLMQ